MPSMVGQSDDGFDLVVMTSRLMPELYIERLQDLLAPFPNIHCRTYWPHNHFRLLNRGFASVPERDATHQAFFRLDDDDCLDGEFIHRTRHAAERMLPLQGPDAPFAITGNRGFYARKAMVGVEVYDTCEHAPLSAGATLVGRVGQALNPYRFNHRRFAQHYNTYSDISVPSFCAHRAWRQ